MILAWARTYNLPYVIVRPTNNYGEGQYVEKLIPKAIKYLQLGRKIPLHNNGSPVRTWLHAEDTAQSIIKIIDSNVVNEIYKDLKSSNPNIKYYSFWTYGWIGQYEKLHKIGLITTFDIATIFKKNNIALPLFREIS